jgi:threonine/homoserine/homoserine lactone efflux protein
MSEGLMVWPTLFLLGAYHGINPGMGWLFAVARGMQEHRARAVAWSLPPIALGHALSIGAVVSLAELAQVALPLTYVRIGVAIALVGLGVYKLARSRHFRWGGMQVGFRQLTIWSFLMASAHGAGLMVLPVVLAGPHAHHAAAQGMANGVWATLVHTLGYFTVTFAVALLVYQKFGLALLRRAWFNLDLIWALALIATGCLALFV